jgi:hypothetical protein
MNINLTNNDTVLSSGSPLYKHFKLVAPQISRYINRIPDPSFAIKGKFVSYVFFPPLFHILYYSIFYKQGTVTILFCQCTLVATKSRSRKAK